MLVDRLCYGNNIACHLVIAIGSITVKSLLIYHIINSSQIIFRIHLEVSYCCRLAGILFAIHCLVHRLNVYSHNLHLNFFLLLSQ